jgi:hypothetical protein
MARRPAPTLVDFDEWLSNVHDVFMNAQLMRTLMERAGRPERKGIHDVAARPT